MNGIGISTIAAVAAILCSSAWAESASLGLPPLPIPDNNPQTPDKVTLGQRLFEDARFSADGTISCASCHKPDKAFSDGLPTAEGISKQRGTRNTPTVLNAAYYTTQFWDGRRPDLESQARDPLLNPIEHGLKSHQTVIDIIRRDPDYPGEFKQVFGITRDAINIDHVVMAIAAFERTIVSGNSPFDRYQYAGDQTAMSASAIRGLETFRTKGRCVDCHKIEQTAATFTDNEFHNLGVGFKRIETRMFDIVDAFRASQLNDQAIDESVLTQHDVSELGRFAVTLRPSDIGQFKTPTLRNIELTAPYMHDGSQKTLQEVIEFYDQGGEQNPMLDGGIRPLNLTDQEKADLVEFMKALTSPNVAQGQFTTLNH